MKLIRSQQSAVSNQQSAVGSQQSVGAGLAPALLNVQRKLRTESTTRPMDKFLLLFLSLISFFSFASAQPDSSFTIKSSPVEMATGLRSNGKIYVVVAVLVIILAGLIFYLIRLDRKITRLEKEGNN